MESKPEKRQSSRQHVQTGRRREEMMVYSSFRLSRGLLGPRDSRSAPASAQTAAGAPNLSGGKVKIGVLTDIAGPTAMANGKGSVIAAEMAAEDFGAGLNVEVISADHQGKPDVGFADRRALVRCRRRRRDRRHAGFSDRLRRAEYGRAEEQDHAAVRLDLVGLQRQRPARRSPSSGRSTPTI